MRSDRKVPMALFFNHLISGERREARAVLDRALEDGVLTGESAITDLCWPVLEQMQALHRDDQLSRLAFQLATRLMLHLLPRLQRWMTQHPARGTTVLVCTGDDMSEEVAGQMLTELLEAHGYQVYFCGGDVPRDEIVAHVARVNADVLVVFGATPRTVPATRLLISQLYEIGACPRLQVAVGGGVFNRAEGWAETLGADLWAADPGQLVKTLNENPGWRIPAHRRAVGARRRARAQPKVGSPPPTPQPERRRGAS